MAYYLKGFYFLIRYRNTTCVSVGSNLSAKQATLLQTARLIARRECRLHWINWPKGAR